MHLSSTKTRDITPCVFLPAGQEIFTEESLGDHPTTPRSIGIIDTEELSGHNSVDRAKGIPRV